MSNRNRNRQTENTPETKAAVKKVVFRKTYCGALGLFYKGQTYDLTPDLYKAFKGDCEEVR
jgi:hypothetical protein